MKITIFTPSFNRAYILPQLYKSLCNQSHKDFEWLIIDDGSTDDTESLIATFQKECKIEIVYLKSENKGKHRAINKGVELARGELFFIVDSDDSLSEGALEIISKHFENIRDDRSFAGVSGLRVFPNGKRIGGEVNFNVLDCTSLEFRMKYHINGDMAEVWRTDVIKQYPFPDVIGETFCPEALVWNRIAQHYKLRYFAEGIYICEYLPDGLTAKITKIRRDSPTYSRLYYSELFHMDIPFLQKIKAAINYWRFTPLKDMLPSKTMHMGNFISLCVIPIGMIFRLKDKQL